MAEKITDVGAKIHLCGNSGSAMTNRLRKAAGVFDKWSIILCDTTVDLTKRIPCCKASVPSCLGWQSGSWTRTKKQESHLASLRARLHARMLGVSRGPMRIHRMGHRCMKQHKTFLVNTFRVQKHRMTGHTSHDSTTRIFLPKTLHCRDFSWWRQQQQNWEVNGDKWSGVHPARFACWRWEQDFELSCGRSMRDEAENADSF